jgi:hypothetical protein
MTDAHIRNLIVDCIINPSVNKIMVCKYTAKYKWPGLDRIIATFKKAQYRYSAKAIINGFETTHLIRKWQLSGENIPA